MTTSPDRAGLLREAAQSVVDFYGVWHRGEDNGKEWWTVIDPLRAALAATGDSEGPLDVDSAITIICDTLWDNGVYMEDSVPVAREIVRRLAARLAATGDSEGPLDVERLHVALVGWWMDGGFHGRVTRADAEDIAARLSSKGYDKADHAAREGVPEGDLG